MRVPGAITPAEPNDLLNPLHPGIAQVRLRRRALAWDERLF
nr:hypothetical protein [uncultured Meiothermus sp.]